MATKDAAPKNAEKPDLPNSTRREKLFLRGMTLVLLAVSFLLIWPLRTPVVFAIVSAFLVYRPFQWTSRFVHKRLAAIWILLMVALVVFGPIALAAVLLAREARSFAASLDRQHVREQIEALAARFGFEGEQAREFLQQGVERVGAALVELLVPALEGLLGFALGIVIFFALLYFLLVDGAAFTNFLHRVTPLPENRRQRLAQITTERVHALFLGTIMASVIQGIVAGLGWWLLGLPAPVFWGFVMMVLSVIPVIGAFIVLIPAALWAFATGDLWVGIGLLVLNFVIVGLVDDLVRPYLIGRRSRVHTAWILLGLLGGILVFGVSGLVLGPIILGLVPPFLQAWMEPGEGSLDEPVPDAEG